MKEEWKDILGFEGAYQVSNLGNVRSLDRFVYQQGRQQGYKGVIMSPYKNKNGYSQVSLHKANKKYRFLVHRLVAQAFVKNPHSHPIVNHKDENPSNNCSDNLEWCTREYNVNYGTATERRARKMGKTVAQYTKAGKLVASYYSIRKAARETGIAKPTIQDCVAGKLFSAGGYIWIKSDKPEPTISVNLAKNSSRIVQQYDTELNLIAEYASAHKAGLYTGFCHENICACCRGEQKLCNGYIFVYEGDTPKLNTQRSNQRDVEMLSIKGEHIKRFESIAAASKYLGGGKNAGIKQCLYGKNKTAYGYKWRYANDKL